MKYFLTTILLFNVLSLSTTSMAQSPALLFLHGNYTDIDWEQLEFNQEEGKTAVYYNYAEAKTGRIKLNVKEELQIAGRSILKVEFPKIAKIYFITLEDDMKNLKMNDEDGNYEKHFRYYTKNDQAKSNNKSSDHTNIQSAFNWYLSISPDYCIEENCIKAGDLWRSKGGELACNLGVSKETANFIYGDINHDNKTDAIVSFGLMQCDGGNALCGKGEQLLIVSTMSDEYKVHIPLFSDHETGAWHNMTAINPDGSIYSYNYFWAKTDQRCQPSIEKKEIYRFSNGELIKMER